MSAQFIYNSILDRHNIIVSLYVQLNEIPIYICNKNSLEPFQQVTVRFNNKRSKNIFVMISLNASRHNSENIINKQEYLSHFKPQPTNK